MYENNSNNTGYNPYGQNPYVRPKEPNQNLYTASMVLGILSIVTGAMMTVYLPFILGGIAIILAILSKGQNKELHKSAKIGIITAIIGLVANIIIVSTSIYTVFTNPEAYNQFNSMVEQMYGESFEDMMNELQGGQSGNISL